MKALLAVEDDLTQQFVLKVVFEEIDLEVEVVSSAEDALLAFSRNKGGYEAILMDIRLPGMDGFECTRQIRRLENNKRRIPIIAVTAYASAEDRQRCLEAGMDDYISKPFEIEQFRSLISKWIGRDARFLPSWTDEQDRGGGLSR